MKLLKYARDLYKMSKIAQKCLDEPGVTWTFSLSDGRSLTFGPTKASEIKVSNLTR